MIETSIPTPRTERITKKALKAQITDAARALRYAKGAIDRNDLESCGMWVRFSEKDLHEVETLLRGA